MSPRFYGLVILAALGILRGCIVPAPVEAQVVSDETLLLRSCSHESTTFSLDDCTGIAAVVMNDAHGRSIGASIRAHSPHLHAGQPGEMNAWAASLEMTCERPRGFRLRWDEVPIGWTQSRHAACLALAAHVRELLAGPARVDATAWGSLADAARRRAQGCDWIAVPVGAARNVFMRALRCPGGV